MNSHTDNHYLIPNRLTDVMRLIIVLAVDKHNFRSEQGLSGILHDTPASANSWLHLAKQHPEFFRFNKEKTTIILLIRFLQQVDVGKDELRPPLSVDQTQKLVEQAITLHDKQLARYQRDFAKSTITAAWIAAVTAIAIGLLTFYTATSSNGITKADLNSIKEKLDKHLIRERYQLDSGTFKKEKNKKQ